MSTFRFKHFDIVNERSAMKVNTDGVILGAAATLRGACANVLDIGTGTGTVALMLSQRLSPLPGTEEPLTTRTDFSVTGIDIDKDSAEEAEANFAASPWADRLSAKCCALQDYATSEKYDLIVSNPPYFDDSLRNPDERKCRSRHSGSLPHAALASFAEEHLTDNGILSVILPEDLRPGFCRTLRGLGLYPFRVLKVRSTVRKPFARAVVEACRNRPEAILEEELTIREGDGWSAEYLALTREFYLFA